MAPRQALVAPPAPLFQIIAGRVVVTAQGGDDTGGLFEGRIKPQSGGDWELAEQVPWAAVLDQGPEEIMEGWIGGVREIGNGSSYLGVSEWSADLVGPPAE